MIKFEQILNVETMTLRDCIWLERGCEGAWDKATPDDQIRAVKNGQAYMFRVSGDVEGIFVIAIGDRATKKLVITALAGRGMIKNFPELYRKVKELCKSTGASALYGFVSRKGLKKLYAKYSGLESKAEIFLEEFT
jgi:hypothetical protein